MDKKPKMAKASVPEDFTLSLAIVDALPVLFFRQKSFLPSSEPGGSAFKPAAHKHNTSELFFSFSTYTGRINVRRILYAP